MPNWTKEQELAITQSGTNILVSAGAGSGKTAVLTERVIRKLKSGISIKNMLILTFTNNAAHEMKERIRKAIKKASFEDNRLKNELDYIDNAYITTFDSFSLSLVKKYHYLLGIGNDISIIDSSIIDLKRDEYIEDIFEEHYKEKDESFLKLVNLLCVKDDTNLKKLILDINKKIDLIEDKNDYLNTYIERHFNEEFISGIIENYEKLLIEKINTIKNLLYDIESEIDGKYYQEYLKELSELLKSKNYNTIRDNSCIKLGTLRNATELGKELKSEITSIIKDINNMCYYSKDDIINNLIITKDYVESIISIIRELDFKILNFKKDINKYEFNDISLMAINIVKNNKEIRDELKDSFDEICVDEYQDTNDLQESFINLISNNNVYMVGDIKQSIYKFRNANPSLFKSKYDMYSKLNDGIKIDLVKNFRSRKEVLDDINNVFNLIMDNYIGGAEYNESHNMVFGNNTYINEGKTNQNNNLEIYNYEYNRETGFKKEEIEAFIIGNDIKNKISSHYKVFDKDNLVLRDALYKDFVILMDRSTNFNLYKKVFEYLGIPTTLYMDENILNENEIHIIKNIIDLIIKIKNKEYDTDFKYSFISVARSYLSNLNDSEIFNIFKDDSFINTDIYRKCYDISLRLSSINNSELLDIIVDKFDFINKAITIGNIDNKINILDYLKNNFSDLDSIGYGIYELNNYLESLINNDKEIKINMSLDNGTTVKIMNIHKSKGLEYNICYYSGYDKKFNLRDLNKKIIYDNKYGIIVPINNEGLEDVITKDIIKNNYIKDDISEKIRLLYVAMTRAKEKMIIVGNFIDDNNYSLEENGVIENRIRSKYNSFRDIILSIKNRLGKYFVNYSLNNVNLTHDYNNIIDYNLNKNIESSNEVIIVKENNIDKIELDSKHFSKESISVIDNTIKENMDYGTYLHELFESIDFKSPDYSLLDEKDIKYIDNFLNQALLNNIKEAKIYKEYEFIYKKDSNKLHGIIDLMLEYDDYIYIIDYKLMNTADEEYINQLNGYKEYINDLFKKDVKLYLYSIINDEFRELSI